MSSILASSIALQASLRAESDRQSRACTVGHSVQWRRVPAMVLQGAPESCEESWHQRLPLSPRTLCNSRLASLFVFEVVNSFLFHISMISNVTMNPIRLLGCSCGNRQTEARISHRHVYGTGGIDTVVRCDAKPS